MKAVQISDPGKVELIDLPEPDAGPEEALVTVMTAGICGTDRRLARRGADPPLVPGHEVAGRLEDGTPVGVHPDIGCGRCAHCRVGFESRCAERVSIGLDRDGGLAEMVVVPEDHLLPLEDVPPHRAPLLEPLACCLQAVSLLPVEPGTPALVVGAGSMGILSMWALQAAGAQVVVCQRSEPRRSMAAELGADAVVSPEGDPAEALGAVPHIGLVTAPEAAALAWALEKIEVGGAVHAFAGMPGAGEIDANLVHYRHLTLLGSTGSRVSDYRQARQLVKTGAVDLEHFPVASVPLAAAPDAFLEEPEPHILKVIVEIEEGGQW